jgi:putative peptide zinc metalloprotease protein
MGGGGLIPLDPGADGNPKAFRSIFQFELMVPDAKLYRLDERVYIRVAHTPEPMVYRWYRTVRRLFLSRFAT